MDGGHATPLHASASFVQRGSRLGINGTARKHAWVAQLRVLGLPAARHALRWLLLPLLIVPVPKIWQALMTLPQQKVSTLMVTVKCQTKCLSSCQSGLMVRRVPARVRGWWWVLTKPCRS